MSNPKFVLPEPAVEWGRWVTEQINGGQRANDRNNTNIRNVERAAAAATSAAGTAAEGVAELKIVPGIPAGLAGTTEAGFNKTGWLSSSVSLYWEPSENATRYQIVGGPTGEASGLLGEVVGAYSKDIPDFTISGLPPATEYTFVVRAGTAAGVWSPFSGTFVITTSSDSPLPPTPPAPVLTTANGAVAAEWDGKDSTDAALPNWVSGLAAFYRVNGGAYIPGGQFLSRAGSIVLSGLNPGDVIDVYFALRTTWGFSQQGVPATITVVGVDLGSLESDVADAIADAEQAGIDAAAAAGAATSAANAATTAANTATTTANGKNKVIWATTDATGTTGYVTGDLWYKRSGTEVVGVWEFVGGAWTARTITNDAITNLNAGKLTAGFVNAARIQASSLDVTKLNVGDFTNYADGSNFENAATIPWTLPTPFTRDSAQKFTGGWSLKMAGNGSSQIAPLARPIAADVGESFYFEVNVYRDASYNGTSANSKLRIADQGGALLGVVTYDAATVPVGVWTVLSTVLVVPAGVTGLQVDLRNDATAGNIWVDDVLIRRMYQGALLVDGTITGTKILAESITGTHILGETITGVNIAAQTITGDKVQAHTITAQEIAGNTITANEIAANTITVDQLEAGIGGRIDVTGNQFVIDLDTKATDTADGLAATDLSLEATQTVFAFDSTGATIYAPDGDGVPTDTYLELKPSGITLHAAGFEASTWTAAEMHVPVMRGDQVILGNHQIETYGTGTVVRFVGQAG